LGSDGYLPGRSGMDSRFQDRRKGCCINSLISNLVVNFLKGVFREII
jgi:hypothetical protein